MRAFIERLWETEYDLRALAKARLAAIGPATAKSLSDHHLRADLIPEEFVSESLVQGLLEQVRGGRVLLVRAEQGRELLREALAQVAQVQQVAVYRQIENPDLREVLTKCWTEGPPDFVLLTSSNIARAILQALTPEQVESIHSGAVRLVTISPITSAR